MAKPKEKKTLKGPISDAEFNRPTKQPPRQTDSWVEAIIQRAMKDGKFSNLKNEGKPLEIEEDNPYVDEDMRLAYHIMSQAGAAPPWVDMEKALLADLEQARRERASHRTWLIRRLAQIKEGPYQTFLRDLRRLADFHDQWMVQHTRNLHLLNEKIHNFNNACPVQQLHKILIMVDQTIADFDKTCPGIPRV
ncbi:MAG: hypothetical protein JWP00_205 [Chloroflexi bacterium]|jgi:hypothetical protein|nr:hypothetical protein [Chloroflexota bacterium]